MNDESDFSCKKILCDNASNKKIETCEFYNMDQNSTINFTKRYNKSEVTLYGAKIGRSWILTIYHHLPLSMITYPWKEKSKGWKQTFLYIYMFY